MATFIQTTPLWTGEFEFGTYYDGAASTPSTTGCLMTPPPYRISTDSPASRSNMVSQTAINQMHETSFFDEAVSVSPMLTEVTYGFPPPSPQYVTGSNIPDGSAYPSAISPPMDTVQKPVRYLRNRRSSQQKLGALTADTGGTIAGALKPRKRGRRPKDEPKAPTNPNQKVDFGDDDEDIPKDPRRRKILERNRIAATKCRLRKRDEASALASREQAMEDKNRHLAATFDSLTTEIYHLKTQLLRHTDCNCTLIQKYIANEARKSVDGLMACSSNFQPDHLTPPAYHRGSSGSGTSVADSFDNITPKMETTSPAWTAPFHQDSSSPEVGEDVFEKVLESFPKEHIPLPCHQLPCTPSVDGYDPGIMASMGHPLRTPGGVIWEPAW